MLASEGAPEPACLGAGRNSRPREDACFKLLLVPSRLRQPLTCNCAGFSVTLPAAANSSAGRGEPAAGGVEGRGASVDGPLQGAPRPRRGLARMLPASQGGSRLKLPTVRSPPDEAGSQEFGFTCQQVGRCSQGAGTLGDTWHVAQPTMIPSINHDPPLPTPRPPRQACTAEFRTLRCPIVPPPPPLRAQSVGSQPGDASQKTRELQDTMRRRKELKAAARSMWEQYVNAFLSSNSTAVVQASRPARAGCALAGGL